MAINSVDIHLNAFANFSPVFAEVTKLKAAMADMQSSSFGNTLSSDYVSGLQKAQQQFTNLVNSTRAFNVQSVQMADSVSQFSKQLESGQLKLGQYYNIWKQNAQGVSTQLDDLATQQARVARSVVVPDALHAGYSQVITDLNGVVTDTEKAAFYQTAYNTTLRDGANKLIDFGKNMQWAGRQLTVGLTVPLGLFANQAAQTYLSFDKQMTDMLKVYGSQAVVQSQATLDTIKNEVTNLAENLAHTIGITMTDTVTIAQTFSQMGLTGQDLLKTTDATAKLMKIGGLTAADSAQAAIAMQNVFKLQSSQMTDAINFLNAAKHSTSTSMQDLVEAMPKVGPIITQMGGSYKDFATLLVALRENGVPASQAANTIKSMFATLINPTTKAVNEFNNLGISLKGIVAQDANNPLKMLQDLQAALDKLPNATRTQAIEQLFGKFQFARADALISSLGKAGSQNEKVMQLYASSSSELAAVAQQEVDVASKGTPAAQYAKMKASLQADLIPVGREFLVVMTNIGNVLDGIVKWFDKLGSMKSVLIGGLAVVGLIGPLVMFAGLFSNLVGTIFKGFNYMRMFKEGFTQATDTGPLQRFAAGLKNMSNFYHEVDVSALAASHSTDLMELSAQNSAKAFDVLATAIRNLTTQISALNAVSVNPGALASDLDTVITEAGTTAREATGALQMELPMLFASGGNVPGTGSGDTVPAMLTPGEFVVNKSAAAKYSTVLSAMNRNNLPGYMTGGQVVFNGSSYTGTSSAQKVIEEIQANFSGVESIITEMLDRLALNGKITASALKSDPVYSEMQRVMHMKTASSNAYFDTGRGNAANTGLARAHTTEPITLTADQVRAMYASGAIDETTHGNMMGTFAKNGSVNAYSESIMNLPAAANKGYMSGNELADWLQAEARNPNSEVYKNFANVDEPFKQGMITAIRSHGSKLVGDAELNSAVQSTIDDEFNGVSQVVRDSVIKERNTFKTYQYTDAKGTRSRTGMGGGATEYPDPSGISLGGAGSYYSRPTASIEAQKQANAYVQQIAEQSGKSWSVGVAKGINDSQSIINDAEVESVNATLESGRGASEAASPSGLFRRMLGQPIGQGTAAGITDTIPDVEAAAKASVEAASTATQEALQMELPFAQQSIKEFSAQLWVPAEEEAVVAAEETSGIFSRMLASKMGAGGAGMGLAMVAPMLTSMLPKGGVSSAIGNVASMSGMGMMAGMAFGPEGAPIGAAIGAAAGAVKSLFDMISARSASVAAEWKANTTSSVSDLQIFKSTALNTAVQTKNLSLQTSNLSTKTVTLKGNIVDLGNGMSSASTQVQAMVAAIKSLPKGDPLGDLVKAISDPNYKITGVVGNLKQNVQNAISTGGLDPSQAKAYVYSALQAAGRTTDFETAWKEISRSIGYNEKTGKADASKATTSSLNALVNSQDFVTTGLAYGGRAGSKMYQLDYSSLTGAAKAYADQLNNLYAITSNSSLGFKDMQDRINAVKAASGDTSTALDLLEKTIIGTGSKDDIARLTQVEGYIKGMGPNAKLSASEIMKMNAVLQVMTPDQLQAWAKANGTKLGLTAASKMGEIIDAYAKSGDFQKAVDAANKAIMAGLNGAGGGAGGGGGGDSTTSTGPDYAKIYAPVIKHYTDLKKLVDAQAAAQQKYNDQLKLTQDYQTKQMDYFNQMKQATISGDYLAAAQAQQSAQNAQATYAGQLKAGKQTDLATSLSNIISALQDASSNSVALKNLSKYTGMNIPTTFSSKYDASLLGGISTASYEKQTAGVNSQVQAAVAAASKLASGDAFQGVQVYQTINTSNSVITPKEYEAAITAATQKGIQEGLAKAKAKANTTHNVKTATVKVKH